MTSGAGVLYDGILALRPVPRQLADEVIAQVEQGGDGELEPADLPASL